MSVYINECSTCSEYDTHGPLSSWTPDSNASSSESSSTASSPSCNEAAASSSSSWAFSRHPFLSLHPPYTMTFMHSICTVHIDGMCLQLCLWPWLQRKDLPRKKSFRVLGGSHCQNPRKASLRLYDIIIHLLWVGAHWFQHSNAQMELSLQLLTSKVLQRVGRTILKIYRGTPC